MTVKHFVLSNILGLFVLVTAVKLRMELWISDEIRCLCCLHFLYMFVFPGIEFSRSIWNVVGLSLIFFFPLSLVFYYRQAWASNIDLRDPRFLAFAAAQHQFLQSDYEEYSIENSGAFAYFRMVVIAVSLILFVL